MAAINESSGLSGNFKNLRPSRRVTYPAISGIKSVLLLSICKAVPRKPSRNSEYIINSTIILRIGENGVSKLTKGAVNLIKIDAKIYWIPALSGIRNSYYPVF